MKPDNNPDYFLTIVAERSVSKAAEKLFVTQSYLSQYVSKLEREYGVKLLNRAKTPIEVTAAGQLYCNYLENSYQLSRKLSADFDNLNKARASVLNMGLGPWRGSVFLPDVLPHFMKTHPNVQVKVYERSLDLMYGLLEQNKIDFAIMNTMTTPENMVTEIIRYETAVLVANRNNPLTKKLSDALAQNVPDALRLIENENVFVLSREQPIGNLVQNYLDKCKIYPRNKIVFTNSTTATNLISDNMGVGFMIDSGIRRASKDENLVFINLKSPDLYAPLCVVYKKEASLSLVARDFINMAKEYYASVKFPYAPAGKK